MKESPVDIIPNLRCWNSMKLTPTGMTLWNSAENLIEHLAVELTGSSTVSLTGKISIYLHHGEGHQCLS